MADNPECRHYDYISEQGLWVYVFIAAVLLVSGALRGSVLAVSTDALFYVLGGLSVHVRLNAKFVDVVTDQLPRVLWPKMQYVFMHEAPSK